MHEGLTRPERAREEWRQRVDQVFQRTPRDGSLERVIWLHRKGAETRLGDLLAYQGVSICIDGPTGAGKSSLALTQLGVNRRPYVQVQVTRNMNWVDFCKCLINLPAGRQVSHAFEGGMKGPVPQLKYSLHVGPSRGAEGIPQEKRQLAASFTEHDLAELLVSRKLSLLVDDLERAEADLIYRLGDLCKLMSQSYSSKESKIILVGTDDVFARLVAPNKSLETRIEEVTVGTLPSRSESWSFLQLGFEALNLRHPGNDVPARSKSEIRECQEAIFEAADGLLKSLIQLGQDVAIQGSGRPRISSYDIKKAAADKLQASLYAARNDIPLLLELIRDSMDARLVLSHMYQVGIGGVFHISNLATALWPRISEKAVTSAIDRLVKKGFLIRTGESREIVFTAKPRLAHLLGIVVSKPEMYTVVPEDFALLKQLQPSLLLRPPSDEPESSK